MTKGRAGYCGPSLCKNQYSEEYDLRSFLLFLDNYDLPSVIVATCGAHSMGSP
jgi:hypothetical protein